LLTKPEVEPHAHLLVYPEFEKSKAKDPKELQRVTSSVMALKSMVFNMFIVKMLHTFSAALKGSKKKNFTDFI